MTRVQRWNSWTTFLYKVGFREKTRVFSDLEFVSYFLPSFFLLYTIQYLNKAGKNLIIPGQGDFG